MDTHAGDGPVEAVVRLRPDPGQIVTTPEETERVTHELVSRTQQVSGEASPAVNVFRYLGSFAIAASPKFMKALVAQPEVESALANRQPSQGSIAPVDKHEVPIGDIGRESGRPSAKGPRQAVKRPAAKKAAPASTRAARTTTRPASKRAATRSARAKR